MLWISDLWLNQHGSRAGFGEIDPPCRLLGGNWLRVALNWCQQGNALIENVLGTDNRIGPGKRDCVHE